MVALTVINPVRFFTHKETFAMSNRDMYFAKMKLQLDEWNAALNELEAEAQKAKEEMRGRYKAEMSELRQQSQLAIDKLDELKAASEESWESLVAGTEKVRDAFIHSFHYFKSQL
jgi:ATP/maltotriose-dependent transcriptional regulator MalT